MRSLRVIVECSSNLDGCPDVGQFSEAHQVIAVHPTPTHWGLWGCSEVDSARGRIHGRLGQFPVGDDARFRSVYARFAGLGLFGAQVLRDMLTDVPGHDLHLPITLPMYLVSYAVLFALFPLSK